MYKADVVLHLVKLHSIEEPRQISMKSDPIPPKIQEIIDKFSPIFQPLPHLPPPRPGDHSIPLLPGAQPFRIRPYRYNPFQKDEIERQIADLLQKGLIQQSTSPLASPVLLVKKKTGDWRLCVDYRRLKALTIKNKYPLPVIDELINELSGALNLWSRFYQIRMAAGEEFKTAFQTHNGHYEYNVMPYGVTSGPSTF
jgi:hypothetical protein